VYPATSSFIVPVLTTSSSTPPQVAHSWLAALETFGLPRAGRGGAAPLNLSDFVGSKERLAWARANGCAWEERTCACAAAGGNLDVLRWAHVEEGCPWDESTCGQAAQGGHLEVLKWAREQHCLWIKADITRLAALGGHLAGRCRFTLSNPS
jgi:hypothetical protein